MGLCAAMCIAEGHKINIWSFRLMLLLFQEAYCTAIMRLLRRFRCNGKASEAVNASMRSIQRGGGAAVGGKGCIKSHILVGN